MKIGSEYRISAITGRHWRAFAARNSLDAERLLGRIDKVAGRLPEAFREVASADAVTTLGSELLERLTARVEEHVKRCRTVLEAS